MIYPIVIYGSQTLRNVSENIAPDYPELEKLVEDMFLTLGEADGVGLAAPQIGKNIRLFVVDCTPWGDEPSELAEYRRAFINAEIYERSEETSLFNEGCLSLQGCTRTCGVPSRFGCVTWTRSSWSTTRSSPDCPHA